MTIPRFIVLEGIDGSGTTTQCKRLAAALRERGHQVHETFEPSSGSIGRLTRSLLGERGDPADPKVLALLFAADRLDHLAREVEPALERGEIVVCDRYLLSSWAYQSLDCPPDWVQSINRRARWPDLTFVFDIPARTALDRVLRRSEATGAPTERFERLPLQERLARSYASYCEDPELAGVFPVDAQQTIDDLARDLARRCEAFGL